MSDTDSPLSDEPGIFTRRAKSTNEEYCAVMGCGTKAHKNLELRFHSFPKRNKRRVYITDYFDNKKEVDQYEAWKTILKIDKVTSSTRVCSLHFRKHDYHLPDVPAIRPRLKPNVVPSLNIPSSLPSKKRGITRGAQARLKRRKEQRKAAEKRLVQEKQNDPVESKINKSVIVIQTPCDEHVCKVMLAGGKEASADTSATESNKDGDEVEEVTAVDKPRFIEYIKTDSELKIATGLESFDCLRTIVDSVKMVLGDKYEKSSVHLKTTDRVLLTYLKLKQNLSFSFLGIVFNCPSPNYCERIFSEILQTLSRCLKVALPWPSREIVRQNVPECFQGQGLENVRVVLECVELHIQRPKKLCCQLITYSHGRAAQTCKVMIGVTPAGNVSFVSKVHGGSVTDTAIFEQSDLANALEPGDAVMVDRGLLVEDICKKNGWSCVKSPVAKDKQLTSEESRLADRIAAARVPVDWTYQQIKSFNILNSKIPVHLVPLVHDVFITICGTVNLNSSVLKPD